MNNVHWTLHITTFIEEQWLKRKLQYSTWSKSSLFEKVFALYFQSSVVLCSFVWKNCRINLMHSVHVALDIVRNLLGEPQLFFYHLPLRICQQCFTPQLEYNRNISDLWLEIQIIFEMSFLQDLWKRTHLRKMLPRRFTVRIPHSCLKRALEEI